MQKFLRGHRVKITNEHRTGKGKEAIVQYSYSDVYGKEQHHSYSLLIMFAKDRMSSESWFYENEIELVDDDRDRGEIILQNYK